MADRGEGKEADNGEQKENDSKAGSQFHFQTDVSHSLASSHRIQGTGSPRFPSRVNSLANIGRQMADFRVREFWECIDRGARRKATLGPACARTSLFLPSSGHGSCSPGSLAGHVCHFSGRQSGWIPASDTIHSVAEIGAIFVLFNAGLETSAGDLIRVGPTALLGSMQCESCRHADKSVRATRSAAATVCPF
jgi:hypothetical protein